MPLPLGLSHYGHHEGDVVAVACPLAPYTGHCRRRDVLTCGPPFPDIESDFLLFSGNTCGEVMAH